jgi:hypothetical protein
LEALVELNCELLAPKSLPAADAFNCYCFFAANAAIDPALAFTFSIGKY